MIKRFAASAIFLAGIGLAALLAVHAGIDSVKDAATRPGNGAPSR